MRKPDLPVQEVTCSETGKPMPKIPLWMADVKVRFISDEARQKHPALPGLADIEAVRRSVIDIEDTVKEIDVAGAVIDDDPDFIEADVEVDIDDAVAED